METIFAIITIILISMYILKSIFDFYAWIKNEKRKILCQEQEDMPVKKEKKEKYEKAN